MKTADERKKFKADVKSKASEVFAQEDQAKMQAKVEELFDELMTELAVAKTDKEKVVDDNTRLTEDLETLKVERDDLEKSKNELEVQAADLQKKLNDADEKIKDLEGKFEAMKQEAALQARIVELEEAGLLSGGKAIEKQKTRIKVMSDEEFTEYKSELSELKEGWAATKKEDPKKPDEDPKKKPEDKKKDPEDEEEDDLAAAAALAELAELENLDETKITASQLLKYKRAAAALNVASVGPNGETTFGISDTVIKEYEGMWEDESKEAK